MLIDAADIIHVLPAHVGMARKKAKPPKSSSPVLPAHVGMARVPR